MMKFRSMLHAYVALGVRIARAAQQGAIIGLAAAVEQRSVEAFGVAIQRRVYLEVELMQAELDVELAVLKAKLANDCAPWDPSCN